MQASLGEIVENAIVTVKTPGQPVRHLRVNATPIVGINGEWQGAWAVMTDVTSLVATARGELNRSLAETVNHNLRTPLTTMLGHAELLLDQQDDFSPEVTRSLHALWRAGQRLKEVVTCISEWIDLAYIPEAEGKGADLAVPGSRRRPVIPAPAASPEAPTHASIRVASHNRPEPDGSGHHLS